MFSFQFGYCDKLDGNNKKSKCFRICLTSTKITETKTRKCQKGEFKSFSIKVAHKINYSSHFMWQHANERWLHKLMNKIRLQRLKLIHSRSHNLSSAEDPLMALHCYCSWRNLSDPLHINFFLSFIVDTQTTLIVHLHGGAARSMLIFIIYLSFRARHHIKLKSSFFLTVTLNWTTNWTQHFKTFDGYFGTFKLWLTINIFKVAILFRFRLHNSCLVAQLNFQ